ncbi:MAG: hypothetical protein LW832_03675 [Parachlamydia sp.]|jgi:2'-5' RNA ligase|nr:hypothetical protein [Parachlamydia sp.]
MTFAIAIELPALLRTRLAFICYGLPAMEWVDEYHFYVLLKSLGELTPPHLSELKENLSRLHFHPFFLGFSTLQVHPLIGKKSLIGLGIANTDHLRPLLKDINALTRNWPLPKTPSLLVPLGYFSRVKEGRLHEYLMLQQYLSLPDFEVNSCSLIELKKSPKTIYYDRLITIKASPLILNE